MNQPQRKRRTLPERFAPRRGYGRDRSTGDIEHASGEVDGTARRVARETGESDR